MGVFLMQRGDVNVRIETGTVGAVDDLVIKREGGREKNITKGADGGEDGDGDKEMREVGQAEGEEDGNDNEVDEEEKTVTRGVSICQLIVMRKASP